MGEKMIKLIFGMIACGMIATPIFVYDKISAQASENSRVFATKEFVCILDNHIEKVLEQQKTDHDLIVKIAYRLRVQ